MAVTAAEPVPYAPASALLEIIGRRRNRGLPIPITAEVLGRASISPSLIPRTLQALKILDLIDDDGSPTPIFEAIRTCAEADYQRKLEEWLKGAYAEVFAFVDPAVDDDVKIRDAFRSYNPAGQQERMVTLFQGLCAAAGLVPANSTSASRPAARSTAATVRPVVAATASVKHIAPRARKYLFPKQQQEPAASSLPPALAGLLKSIPDASRGWTQSDRDRFYATFGTVLDFAIPIRAEAELNDTGGQE